jgi:branched-chain amino acid transport system permease protein
MKINIFSRHKKLAGFFLGVLIFCLIPVFVKSPYYIDLLVTTLVYAVLSMTFVMMLRTGVMNLGIAAFWGIGAYVSMILVRNLGFSFWAALPISGLATALAAAIIGYVLIASGGTGFGFIMLTSVIGMVFTTTVGNIPYVGGYTGFTDVPGVDPITIPFIGSITFSSGVSLYYLAVFIVGIIVLIMGAFYSAWTNRAWTAIGLAPRLAESVGVSLLNYKLLAFIIASAVTGLIGSFFVHYGKFIIPDTYSMWINVYVQIYAILGGLGYALLGPLVGSALMTFIPEWARMASEVSSIFTGVILILLVLFLPGGVLSLVQYRTVFTSWRHNLSRVNKAAESFRSMKDGKGST